MPSVSGAIGKKQNFFLTLSLSDDMFYQFRTDLADRSRSGASDTRESLPDSSPLLVPKGVNGDLFLLLR